MKYFVLFLLMLSQAGSMAQPVFYGVRNLWNGEFASHEVANNKTNLLYSIDNEGYGTGFDPLIKASDLKWYGTTPSGGGFNAGTLPTR